MSKQIVKQIFYLCMLTLTIPAMGQLSPGLNSFSINNRNFDITTPTNYVASQTYPIVFELHGFRQDKSNMRDQGVVDEQQYISVTPEGTSIPIPFVNGRYWNTWPQTNNLIGSPDDVQYLTQVYNKVKQVIGTSFDANRVFAYGYSNGGAMAMKMVKETNLFQAIAIRSMTLVEGESIPSEASKVPMLFIHGTADETVPYNGGEGQYPLSPTFMDVKTAVNKWAVHNGNDPKQDIHYLASAGIGEFWLREYRNNTAATPIYLLAVVNAEHNTNALTSGGNTGFANRNIKRSALRFFFKPRCYGLYRHSDACR